MSEEMKHGDDAYEIGGKLRMLRNRAGLTQEQLGKMIGTDGNSISLYELGERKMGIVIFFKIADALRIDPKELFPDRFQRKDETDAENSDEKELVAIFSALDSDYRELVLGLERIMSEQSRRRR